MKKVLFLFLLAAIFMPVQVQAASLLFEHRERTYLSRDVVFEQSRQITSAGFRDVHILTVPLNDPYITIAPVESQRELGRRETAYNLLSQAGAIAGTNGDFFGMGGTHNLAFGPVVANGQLMSITESYNLDGDEFATFFLDVNNIPMIRYVRPRIWFTVGGMELMRVMSINKVPSIHRPIIINRNGMAHTAQLSERFADLRKVVVDNGIITGISAHPSTVPVNGFIVVMTEEHFNHYRPDHWIGMPAWYDVIEPNLSTVQAAIGGGGIILRHGHTVHDAGTVVGGRQPRTALGFTVDWQHLVLMVVDGRGHSIGATHEEMAELLRSRGVTYAMHLDGGGSSTMVAQAGGRGTPLQVVNRVSDGAQRAIINALGVFDHSVPGALHQLVMLPYNRYIPRGSAVTFQAYGMDLYRHRLGINLEQVIFSAYTIEADGQRIPASGEWQASTFIPDRPGQLYVRAQYGEITASKIYLVQDIVALRFTIESIITSQDIAVPFGVTGITAAGTSSPISPERGGAHFTVTPPELGVVMDHVFMPNEPGRGHITAAMGSVYVHIPVIVTAPGEVIDPLYFANQLPAAPAFADPIRAQMTPVMPGYAFDFTVSLPGGGNFAYSARQEGPAAVVQMTAANGSIFNADRAQWGRFLHDINLMSPSFVIVRMDINPLRMSNSVEAELFHQALVTQQELGRTVFVLSNVEQSSTFTMRDGIRYIDLGNAGTESTVWFRAIDRQIWYDF